VNLLKSNAQFETAKFVSHWLDSTFSCSLLKIHLSHHNVFLATNDAAAYDLGKWVGSWGWVVTTTFGGEGGHSRLRQPHRAGIDWRWMQTTHCTTVCLVGRHNSHSFTVS